MSEAARFSLKSPSTIETGALITATAMGLIALLVAALVFAGHAVELSGGRSIGGLSSLIAGLLGFGTFAASYVRFTGRTARWRTRARHRRMLDVFGLSLTATLMVVLLISSVFAVLQLAFRELALDAAVGSFFVGLTVGVSTYALFLLAAGMTMQRLASMLGVFLLGGLFASMLTADDPLWWQANFSALGRGDAASARTFNLTVLLAGLVITSLADYLTADLRSVRTRTGSDLHGVTIVRGSLLVVGLALVGTGVVPVDVNHVVHNFFAKAALVGFLGLLVLAPLVVADVPRNFRVTTLVFFGGHRGQRAAVHPNRVLQVHRD